MERLGIRILFEFQFKKWCHIHHLCKICFVFVFLKSTKGLEYIPYINDQVIEREIDFIEEIIEMNGNENNSFVREYQFCSKTVNNYIFIKNFP